MRASQQFFGVNPATKLQRVARNLPLRVPSAMNHLEFWSIWKTNNLYYVPNINRSGKLELKYTALVEMNILLIQLEQLNKPLTNMLVDTRKRKTENISQSYAMINKLTPREHMK